MVELTYDSSEEREVILTFIKRKIKDIGLNCLLPSIYRHHSKTPLQHKVLFFSRQGAGSNISPNFEAMKKYIEDESDFTCEVFNLGYPHVSMMQYFSRCAQVVRKVASSEIVFVDDASDVISCLPLRCETTVVNLWHACGAFKKFGMSTANSKFGGTRDEKLKHPFYENLSLVSVSSEEVIPHYAEAMAIDPARDVIKAYGVSRTDIYFDEDYKRARCDYVGKMMPEIDGRKIILYAPTFRGRAKSAKAPDKLDIDLMSDELSFDYVLLVKNHPFVKSATKEIENFAYDVSERIDISDLLIAADICITDYSSVIFEYSLLKRPMIFFCYDRSDYIDWRGFYYNYDEMTPGIKCMNTTDVISAIKAGDSFEYTAQREDFRRRFMCKCDGHSTERIWQGVMEIHRPHKI